jgi:nitrile hydratase
VPDPPRFEPGDRVRTRRRPVERLGEQHTRLPGYAQERSGVVERSYPAMSLPDASAERDERAEYVYAVSFAASDLWPDGDPRSRVSVDVFESYIDPRRTEMATTTDDAALRMRAIETLLIEKGLLTEAVVDRIATAYEHDIGPMRGARVVARAWVDDDFRARLLDDGTAAMAELDVGGFVAEHVVVVENTPQTHNMVVCTLCSCYPWGVLGLPPSWYKSPEYRSRAVREPRAVLREFGLELPEETAIRVWDSSSEVRYLVLPMRPEGTDGLDEAALAELVTRDAMVGTGVPKEPGR